MDCFNDFCLNCDKQCVDGTYCSQSCRLADLEKGNSSNPSSPLSTFSSSAWTPTSNQVTSYLSNHNRSTTKSTDSGRLTPSSSRTSLMSTGSSNNTGMSEQARIELQDYFSSFDQTRAAKRRSSVR